MSAELVMCCPCCGAAVSLEARAVSAPVHELARWRTLRSASERTGQPVGRLRALVRAGQLPARVGPRGAYLVRCVDIDAIADALPAVEPGGCDDELRRLLAAE